MLQTLQTSQVTGVSSKCVNEKCEHVRTTQTWTVAVLSPPFFFLGKTDIGVGMSGLCMYVQKLCPKVRVCFCQDSLINIQTLVKTHPRQWLTDWTGTGTSLGNILAETQKKNLILIKKRSFSTAPRSAFNNLPLNSIGHVCNTFWLMHPWDSVCDFTRNVSAFLF